MVDGGAPTIGNNGARSGGGMSRPPSKVAAAGSPVPTELEEEEEEESDSGVFGAGRGGGDVGALTSTDGG